MISIWSISLIALWCVVLLNLLLTLRLVRWLRSVEEAHAQSRERERLPELSLDTPAPDFRARTLDGEPVRLITYAGKQVVFLFVSPHCEGCRRKMLHLLNLSIQAKKQVGVEFVLVSDSSSAETHAWIDTIRDEDRVEINLPVLIAPMNISDFLWTYNPRGILPYFCLLNAQGNVQARDPLERGAWPRLQREWSRALEYEWNEKQR